MNVYGLFTFGNDVIYCLLTSQRRSHESVPKSVRAFRSYPEAIVCGRLTTGSALTAGETGPGTQELAPDNCE